MRLSLRAALILFLAGLQLLAIAAILIPTYLNSEATLMKHARSLMRDVAFTTIAHSDRFLAPAEAAAELSKRLAENDVVASDDPDLLEKLLFEQLQLTPQFAGIYYGDEAGNFVFVMRAPPDAPAPFRSKHVSRSNGAVKTSLKWRDDDFDLVKALNDPTDQFDPRARPWYMDAKSEGATVWTDPYIFYTSTNPGITVASPIHDMRGSIRGVVGVDIEIGTISNFLAELQIGEHGRALILNHNGDVIAHPDAAIIKTAKADGDGLRFVGIDEIADPIARSAFASMLVDGAVRVPAYAQKGGAKYISAAFDHGDAEYVSTIAPMPNPTHPWTIGVYAPREDFVGALQRDRNRSIVIAIVVALATAAVGAFIANRIHTPVKALADRAHQISRGHAVPPASVPTSFVELRRAGLAFNRMSIWLTRYKEENTTLTHNLQSASDALEVRVEERTADLAAANEQLHGEIETRAAAEETLKNEVRMHADTSARLRVAMAETERANTAKSRFLSSMSHELRSPLNAIIGYTDLLSDSARQLPPEKHQEYLKHVRASGDHLLALVEDVLDLENIESGHLALSMQTIDPAQAIASAVLEQGVSAIQNGVHLTNATEGKTLPTVTVDPNRLRQALVNLLSNAIKYSRTGDEVTVSSEVMDHFLRITVADFGPGIPKELHERLFQPFDRLGAEASNVEGSGVGLALSKQLIERMGGRIGFTSSLGQGSRFWIEAPLAGADAQSPECQEAKTTSAVEAGRRDEKQILYIDDSPLNLTLLEDYLGARPGLTVTTATTGADGLKLLTGAPFDLYLVDINLPDMSGYDVLQEIRRLQGDVPTIAVSADAMPAHIARGLAAGFDNYVTKPVRLQELAEDVETRLAKSAAPRMAENIGKQLENSESD